jgi:hypothetical protein
MPKYGVNVRFPIQGLEIHELEVEASSAEEAEKKAIEFIQTGEVEGVTELIEPCYDDMQTYCEGSNHCEYEVEVGEIDEEETKDA